MKYYSKSPKAVEEKKTYNKKGNKSQRVGRIILLVDIIFIVIIFMYFSNKSDADKSKAKVPIKISEKSFPWNNFKIKAKCVLNSNTCTLKITSSKEIGNKLKSIAWEVRDAQNNDSLFIQNDAVKIQNKEFNSIFTTPQVVSLNQKIYVSINKNSEKSMTFRVFP